MKTLKTAIIAASLTAFPASLMAQDVGTTVYGNDDAPIGTVTQNEGGVVTVDTGDFQAPLPANLLAEREIGWTVNATKDQINSMMAAQQAEANAKRDAALVTGAAVVSANGAPAGVVYSIDDAADAIIVKREGGIITLKREHFAVSPQGALMALFTIDQIAANTIEVPEGAEIVTASQQAAASMDGMEDTAEAGAAADADTAEAEEAMGDENAMNTEASS